MNNSNNIKKKNLEIINKIVKERIDFGNIYSTLEDIDKSEICVGVSTHIFSKESAFLRAKMIESCVAIEMNLAQSLSAYFVEEGSVKFHILNSMVFDRMNLSEKIKKFRQILSKYHIDVYKKYKGNINNVEKLVIFRNELAHSLLSLTEDNIREHSLHTDKVLSKNKNIKELEYFITSFYKDDVFVSKTIKFEDIRNSIDAMHAENQIIIKIKNELINLDRRNQLTFVLQ